MGESVICPHDGHVAHEIFWCDNIRRWFCPHCRRVLNEVEYECRCGHLVRRDTVDEKKAEQQRLFAREVGSAEIELIGLVRANKADLWLENKKLKAALEDAAEIVAKNFCPANHDCPLEEMAFGNCEGDPECTQERAEMCWMEHWMGEG